MTALEGYIIDYITLENFKILAIRTDNGRESDGAFQRRLNQLGIHHQLTPPDTTKFNGVAEPWIGLLREKTIALLGDLEKLLSRYCSILGGCVELLYRRDKDEHDYVERRRCHIIRDVVRQVTLAGPAAPLRNCGLHEKGHQEAQAGAARREGAHDGDRPQLFKRYLKGTQYQR